MKVKVAIVQFETRLNNWETAFERAEKFIAQAVEEGSKFICFPEEFIVGSLSYYRNNPQKINFLEEELPPKFKTEFINLSSQYPITIIAGSINEKLSNKSVVNRAYVFKDGEVIYQYDKINLYSTEKKDKTVGEKLPEVIDIDGVKVGVVICKDLYDPALFQHLAKNGAQIVFVPAYWSANCTYYQKYVNVISKYKVNFLGNTIAKTLSHARAMENGMFICFVNCCGIVKYNNGDFDQLMGKSFIVSPLEGIIAKTSFLKKELMLTATLNMDQTIDARYMLDVPV